MKQSIILKFLTHNIMALLSRKLSLPFNEVVTRVTANLKEQGFGVITTIDMQDTFKQKLNVGFRNYKILGACNPNFAYKAISLESQIGVLLPCNIVIQEHENGEVEVSAVNPSENIERVFTSSQLRELANDAGNRLREAIDDLHHDVHEKHIEALPT
jgi:uncharacterized protein (DUF302 family)